MIRFKLPKKVGDFLKFRDGGPVPNMTIEKEQKLYLRQYRSDCYEELLTLLNLIGLTDPSTHPDEVQTLLKELISPGSTTFDQPEPKVTEKT